MGYDIGEIKRGSMKLTYELAKEAAEYYCELEAGVDEDSLTISPEADVVLGRALEEGLCSFFTAEDVMDVLRNRV